MVACRGKTALVTNASAAAGKAAAMALAKEGARVLIHDQHSTANVEPIVEVIISSGGIARATAADAATPEGSRQLAQETRAVIGDRLDILVIDITAMDPGAPLLLVELLLPILNAGSKVIALQPRRGPEATTARALEQGSRRLRNRRVRIDVVEAEDPAHVSKIGDAVLFLVTEAPRELTVRLSNGRGARVGHD